MIVSVFKKLFSRNEADCAETRKLASDYLDRDLSPGKRSTIQAHLDKCGPCRAFVETLAATIGALSRFPKVTPPPSLRHSIIEWARREEQRRRKG